MNRRITTIWFALFVVLIVGNACAQESHNSLASQPTEFCPDADPDSFKNTVPIPPNVIDVLRSSKEFDSRKDELKGMDREQVAHLFKAVIISPGDKGERDYLVWGQWPMSAADGEWFWLVRGDRAHPHRILFASGNCIDISTHTTNGYRNILSSWTSAAGYTLTWVYKYDGNEYRLWKKFEKTDNSP